MVIEVTIVRLHVRGLIMMSPALRELLHYCSVLVCGVYQHSLAAFAMLCCAMIQRRITLPNGVWSCVSTTLLLCAELHVFSGTSGICL